MVPGRQITCSIEPWCWAAVRQVGTETRVLIAFDLDALRDKIAAAETRVKPCRQVPFRPGGRSVILASTRRRGPSVPATRSLLTG